MMTRCEFERRKREWSRKHLAILAGLDLGRLARLENKGQADDYTLGRLARVLEVEPAAILLREAIALPELDERP